ncbi:MAG: hypothetical protein AAF937_09670 [Planctomycetota bacterium]
MSVGSAERLQRTPAAKPVESPAESPSKAASAAACPVCRYTRADPSVACPECGVLEEAILPELSLLRNAPSRLSTLLRLGGRVVNFGLALRVLGTLGALLWLIAGIDAGLRAAMVSHAVVCSVAAVGWWLLTTPDPRVQRALPGRRLRIGARVAILIEAALCIAAAVITVSLTSEAVLASSFVDVGVLAPLWAARTSLCLLYAREIARKAERPDLARSINAVAKYLGISAMTLSAAVIAVGMTALIPILLPFLAIATVPYVMVLSVIVAIAVVAGARVQLRLGRALHTAPTP